MQYIIDVKFEDSGINALVQLVTTITTNSETSFQLFKSELEAGLLRKKVINLRVNYYRIDDNLELRNNLLNFYNYFLNRATAKIQIEEYKIDNPDQTKGVFENLTDKLFKGEEAIAKVGKVHDIPVRVLDKNTRNEISGDFYYFGIEQIHEK